jgi:multidrug transporter EmrE-like cation transporter
MQRQNKVHEPKSWIRSAVLPGSWQTNTAIVILCVVGTAVLYAGDLHLGFFRIDDPQYVAGNAWVQGVTLAHIKDILTNPYYLNYSPLHLLSYMFDYAIAGLDPYAFHLSSNIWAGIVAGFVYLVALALTQHRLTAVAAALLFIVHPTHVEAVAWISNRKDLVAAAFVLCCTLAYFKYRQTRARSWYIISLLLFLFASLGKLSVAAFPAVLLAVDLFLEKRPLSRAITDKVPFFVLVALVAVAVSQAQPSTRVEPDIGMRAKALVQSMWLLTGLGNYVIYRVPPETGGILLQVPGVAILLGSFCLPLLLRRRYALAVVLIYWILLTYLPTQILPFSYPVTDRYLFLPSAGAVILIAWLLMKAADHFPKWHLAGTVMLIAVVSFIWLAKTAGYLSEWQDPRSVWFAATRKSDDVHVYYELGCEYFQKAAGLGTKRRNAPLPPEEARRYASVVWKGNPQLPQLLSELSEKQHNGAAENAFKEYLQTKAAENFDEAVAKKGRHIAPDLFFSRGVFFIDRADMQSAKREFLAELDEASQLPSSESRQEALITSHYNLAVAEHGLGNRKEALSWISLAEEEQNRLGRTVVPELSANRKKLESMATTLRQSPE